VLLGHRANRDVATMLHIARAGLGSLVAPHGIYACTSQKEEFGVALLEAMATGLAVVAPEHGGPATYVHEGLTGCLADTASVADVREALRRAAAARADETRARRASGLVRSRYTIEAMATSLAGVYRRVVREPAQVAA
jgi:glycosyltransferase involved in cell wall biosynthesis